MASADAKAALAAANAAIASMSNPTCRIRAGRWKVSHISLRDPIIPRAGGNFRNAAAVHSEPCSNIMLPVATGQHPLHDCRIVRREDDATGFSALRHDTPHCTLILGRRCCIFATSTRRPALLEQDPAAPSGAARQKATLLTGSPEAFSPSTSSSAPRRMLA